MRLPLLPSWSSYGKLERAIRLREEEQHHFAVRARLECRALFSISVRRAAVFVRLPFMGESDLAQLARQTDSGCALPTLDSPVVAYRYVADRHRAFETCPNIGSDEDFPARAP